jgi:hypothetical protein
VTAVGTRKAQTLQHHKQLLQFNPLLAFNIFIAEINSGGQKEPCQCLQLYTFEITASNLIFVKAMSIWNDLSM